MRRGLGTVRYVFMAVESAEDEVDNCALCDAAQSPSMSKLTLAATERLGGVR